VKFSRTVSHYFLDLVLKLIYCAAGFRTTVYKLEYSKIHLS
jgi:hypothetical protein